MNKNMNEYTNEDMKIGDYVLCTKTCYCGCGFKKGEKYKVIGVGISSDSLSKGFTIMLKGKPKFFSFRENYGGAPYSYKIIKKQSQLEFNF